jgi:hypothetical protein
MIINIITICPYHLNTLLIHSIMCLWVNQETPLNIPKWKSESVNRRTEYNDKKNHHCIKKLKIATWVELGCWTSSNSCYKPGSKSSRRNSWFRKHLMFLFFFYRWYFHLSVPGSSVYTNVAVGCVTLDWLANLNVRCELCKSKAMMIVFRLCYYIKVSCIWNSIFFL